MPDTTTDPDGKILSLMKTWQQQRLRAIEREMRMLKQDADMMGWHAV